MQSQRDNQSKPKPTAFFAAREQSFGFEPVKVVEIGNSHCGSNISHLALRATVPESGPCACGLCSSSRPLNKRCRGPPDFICHTCFGRNKFRRAPPKASDQRVREHNLT